MGNCLDRSASPTVKVDDSPTAHGMAGEEHGKIGLLGGAGPMTSEGQAWSFTFDRHGPCSADTLR